MTTLSELGLEESTSFKLIDEGLYDAVIHGIVHLGLQPQKPDLKTGQQRPPCHAFKVIFEIPDHIRDDGQTGVISKDMFNKSGEKGTLYKLYTACFGTKMNPTFLLKTPIEELLGKKVALNITHWENEQSGKNGVSVESFGFLDPRLAAIAKPAARDTFFFTPIKPDMNIFTNVLTQWTRKIVMESLNSDQYPKELHIKYKALLQEGVYTNKELPEGLNTESIE